MNIRTVTGRGLALAALTAGVVPLGAAPASASPDCSLNKVIYYSLPSIEAYASVHCVSTGQETPAAVQIQRWDAATGTWVTVASGTGAVDYLCVGTAVNTYRTGATTRDKSVTAPCG